VKTRRSLLLAVILAASAGVSLAGCGQKGNLYLPGQQKKKVPTSQPQPNSQPPSSP
jgi:predicted small lipoprotein YifL